MLPNKNRKELDERLARVAQLLHDTYKNKSSEEYKMKGDITKSSYYSNIEKCIADLSTLRGFAKPDASDLNQLFNTLHRPIFKNMVREYMNEPNEKNTVFCALFTLGFRLLIGELSRIYTSVEATPKGLEYKPNKISRKNDISKIISIYKGDLEAKINAEIHATSKAKTRIEESYIEGIIEQIYIEESLDEVFGDTVYNEAAKIDKDLARKAVGMLVRDPKIAHVNLDDVDDASDDKDGVSPVKEASAIDDLSDEEWSKRGMISARHARNQAIKRGINPFKDPEWKEKLGGVSPVKEGEISTAVDPSYGTTDTDVDTSDGGNSVDSVEEARFGRFSEIPGDSHDMDTRNERNLPPVFQRPNVNEQKPMPKLKDPDQSDAIDLSDIFPSKPGEKPRTLSVRQDGKGGLIFNDESFQEGVIDSMENVSGKISDVADKVGPKIAGIAAWAAPIAAGLDILSGIFRKITGFLVGKNPVAELNFYFTNKYEKIVEKFNAVSANYFATKEAYEEYMKIPEGQRRRKVESKYIQNMEKYNIKMKNLEAQIEHFNSRSKDDVSKPVPKPEPTSAPSTPDKSDNGDSDKPKNDDDFDF